ncbi:MAG: hypothetical protein JRH18_11545 [Deltaproteobacteria bacterium]|nr:hypothetical protein [Deltaproteobacteria bacterium]MBW2152291.1 hypothetical protein [Deltaproteobacteria bacterium]
MIKTLEIRLVTPAMIGGAEMRKLDLPPMLRPPAIRGMLRFWTRALAAGAGLDIHQEETALWGDTSHGQGIVLLPPEPVKLDKIHRLKMFPHKRGAAQVATDMLLPTNPPLTLRFRITSIQIPYLEKLRAVVWAWLHLGSIGRRSRRGYGSLLWEPKPGDLLDGFVDFNSGAALSSEANLAEYLKRGLSKVFSVWTVPVNSTRTVSKVFRLASLGQVFFGHVFRDQKGKAIGAISDNIGGILHIIHGLNTSASGPRQELGHAGLAPWLAIQRQPPRHASPIAWRLFPCNSGFVPVMTWSPFSTTTIPGGTDIYHYLTYTLGFHKSLAGNPL